MKQFSAGRKVRLTPARIGILLCLLLVLALGFLQARSKDTYSRILIATPCGDFDGTAADQSAYLGEMVYADEIDDLYPGTYHLEVNYKTTGAANRIEYVDLETGETLAGGTLAQSGSYWEATLTLSRRVSRLGMRSWLNDGTLWVDSCYFTSSAPVYTDAVWGLLLVLVLGGAGFVLCRHFRAGQRYGLVLFCAGLAVSLPFVSDHLQKGHDLPFHLSRITGLALGLLDGQFPVRLNETFLYGGGYLSSVMYPELFFYLPGVMCAAGASVLFAFKVLCLCVNLLTAAAAYQGMRRLLGDKTGFVFALLYLLNPYRLNDLFLRAAVGEALAMAFLPLAAAGLYDLLQGNARRGFWEALLGITGVFQSHMLSMMLFVVFGSVYAVIYLAGHLRAFFAAKGRFALLCAAAVSTVLVNLWYLVPFLVYSRWDMGVFTDQRQLSVSAITPFQAFIDAYHYGADVSGSETTGEMSQSIGLILLLCAAGFLLLCLAGRLEKAAVQKGTVCLLMGGAAWFMSTDLFPWDALQRISFISSVFSRLQYAWRFLIVAAVLLTVVAAIVLVHLLENRQTCTAAVLAGLAVIAAAGCCSGYLQDNQALILSKSSADWNHNAIFDGQYLLASHDADAVSARIAEGGVACATEDVTVSGYTKRGVNLSYAFTNPSGGEVTFQLPLYSCGMHRAMLDNGEALALSADEQGLLCVTVPAGTTAGTVTVRYTERKLFRLAELVSAVSALGLAAVFVRQRRKKVQYPYPSGI